MSDIQSCQNCRFSWLSVPEYGDKPVLRCRPGGEAAVQLAEIPCLLWESDDNDSSDKD